MLTSPRLLVGNLSGPQDPCGLWTKHLAGLNGSQSAFGPTGLRIRQACLSSNLRVCTLVGLLRVRIYGFGTFDFFGLPNSEAVVVGARSFPVCFPESCFRRPFRLCVTGRSSRRTPSARPCATGLLVVSADARPTCVAQALFTCLVLLTPAIPIASI